MRKAGDVVFTDVDRNGEGVVEFSNRDDMERAVDKLDDEEFRGRDGSSYIRVKFANKERERSKSKSRSRSRDKRRRGDSENDDKDDRKRDDRDRSYSRSRSRSRSPIDDKINNDADEEPRKLNDDEEN